MAKKDNRDIRIDSPYFSQMPLLQMQWLPRKTHKP